jgi:hypothetical protein
MTAKKTKKVQIDKGANLATAPKQPIRHTVKVQRKKATIWDFPLNQKNLLWAGVGLLVIIAGYLFMATGITDEPALPNGTWNNPMAITVAPILLVIGYCVLIPFAILKLFNKQEKTTDNQAE